MIGRQQFKGGSGMLLPPATKTLSFMLNYELFRMSSSWLPEFTLRVKIAKKLPHPVFTHIPLYFINNIQNYMKIKFNSR